MLKVSDFIHPRCASICMSSLLFCRGVTMHGINGTGQSDKEDSNA